MTRRARAAVAAIALAITPGLVACGYYAAPIRPDASEATAAEDAAAAPDDAMRPDDTASEDSDD